MGICYLNVGAIIIMMMITMMMMMMIIIIIVLLTCELVRFGHIKDSSELIKYLHSTSNLLAPEQCLAYPHTSPPPT